MIHDDGGMNWSYILHCADQEAQEDDVNHKTGRESFFGKVDFLALLDRVQRLLEDARASAVCPAHRQRSCCEWAKRRVSARAGATGAI